MLQYIASWTLTFPKSVLQTSNPNASRCILLRKTWTPTANGCLARLNFTSDYSSWFNRLGRLKSDRKSRLLLHAHKDFYQAQNQQNGNGDYKVVVTACSTTQARHEGKSDERIKGNRALPCCCDYMCVYVAEVRLRRSCLSLQLRILTWMTVPLNFSMSGGHFFHGWWVPSAIECSILSSCIMSYFLLPVLCLFSCPFSVYTCVLFITHCVFMPVYPLLIVCPSVSPVFLCLLLCPHVSSVLTLFCVASSLSLVLYFCLGLTLAFL